MTPTTEPAVLHGEILPHGSAKPPTENSTAVTGMGRVLADHATEIRRLGKLTFEAVVEMGCRLTACRMLVKRGQWPTWLEREFGWSADTAGNFMSVYQLTQQEGFDFRKFRDLNLPLSAVYLIAKQPEPEPVLNEVVKLAEGGEKISVNKVKNVIAKKTATKTKPVQKLAGNGADPEQSAETRKAAYEASESPVEAPTGVERVLDPTEILDPLAATTNSLIKAWDRATVNDRLMLIRARRDAVVFALKRADESGVRWGAP